jgi:hypothetical protein
VAIASVGHEHVLNSVGTVSVTINKPAGTADGNRLYALISWLANTTTISAVPSGWSPVTISGNPNNNGQLMTSLYSKVASSEPSSWTWTLSVSGRCWGWVGAYSGVHATIPLADYDANPGSGTSHITPAVDLPPGGWLVTLAAGRWLEDASPAATTWATSDGSDTERKDISTAVASVNNATAAVYDSERPLLGTGQRTLTPSQSMGQIVGWSLALNPAAAAPTGRVYQAYAEAVDLPPPPAGRLYQAYATAVAGGSGTARIYQAYATTAATPGVIPSGLKVRRGGNFADVTTRTWRNGEL